MELAQDDFRALLSCFLYYSVGVKVGVGVAVGEVPSWTQAEATIAAIRTAPRMRIKFLRAVSLTREVAQRTRVSRAFGFEGIVLMALRYVNVI